MSVAVTRYAKALMDVLYPEKAEAGLQQLRAFSGVLTSEPDARLVLENPTVSNDRRNDLLHKIGEAVGLETPVRNFLGILIERNRLDLISQIVAAYESLLDEKLGFVRARVTTARELDAVQKDKVVARLQELTGKQVRIELAVDPELLGGLVAQVGGTIYDGSIRQQLETFKNTLAQD